METRPLPKVCIISGADEIRSRAYINQYIYAREHSHDFRLECGLDTDVRSLWDYKNSPAKRILPFYEWVMWIDDDAYFTNFEYDTVSALIQEAEASGKSIIFAEGAEEPNGWWSGINAGVYLLKNTQISFDFLDDIRNIPLQDVENWWDAKRDGLYTGGDQDQIWMALNTKGYMEHTLIVDHKRLNSRGHYYHNSLSDAQVMHFCGYPDKTIGAARFARRFNIGQELVPEHLLDKYAAQVRSPMSATEYHFRNRKMIIISRIKHDLRPYKKKLQKWKENRKNPQ